MTARNKLNNKARYWGGKAKETVGRITGNRRTQYEGKRDQVKANLKDSRREGEGRLQEVADLPRRAAAEDAERVSRSPAPGSQRR
jgi:uncharacterized protein YjbJ (UPF0337 family)